MRFDATSSKPQARVPCSPKLKVMCVRVLLGGGGVECLKHTGKYKTRTRTECESRPLYYSNQIHCKRLENLGINVNHKHLEHTTVGYLLFCFC